MPQLIYALRFHGAAQRHGPDGNVLRITATAPGCAIHSEIGAEGLTGSIRPAPGEATLESELTFTGETTFQEAGTIVFGPGEHRLRFSTMGSGYLDPLAPDTRRHGSAIRRVDGGDGQFAGASGLITSLVFVSDDLSIDDHHLGVIFVP